jgi:hypothetical protein
MPTPTLIKDLIDIPDRVHKGDFVLRLTEGVERADQTVDSYVVTPELVKNFDDALGFIKSAVDSASSKATYLDGSFGSGKSHFMAILNLLLAGYGKARAIPELAPIVARHAEWMDSTRFLLVPYHMIGANSLESAVLGHYVEHVRAMEKGASIPAVYVADSLFADATNLRRQMGDEAFFRTLNAGQSPGDRWGDLGRTWDAARFEAAISAPLESEDRRQLIGDLVGTLLTSYATAMRGQGEVYVPLEDGLAVISAHAKTLGYDAVILFLDELILWLASRAADTAFVNREIQKIVKLVESQTARRPAPIISFIARQRDLRELVGEHVPGSEQLAFADMLKYWEGRLHRIGLLDRNLPAIAEKRVLKPKDAAARRQLDAAFDELKSTRREVMETLLTTTGDQAMFRQVYPFSPALVTTLVAVSAVLQRERTAIKVMLQLLVEQRDTLRLGDLVPVGDLFDVIAEGDEAFSEGMRQHFEAAKRLYHQKLLPMLETEHALRGEEAKRLPWDDPKRVAFRTDDRLVKSLILAALVPEIEPFKGLTARRLAALNHGTIRVPIPGQEGQAVLGKVRRWAAQVGEIKIAGDNANPTISVQLANVDTAAIVDKARIADNPGERRRKVKEILFTQLGIAEQDELFVTHDFTWRNTERSCDVVFANVRELPDESLRARPDRWKVVIDFPFDEQGFTPADDVARVQQYRERNAPSHTLVWTPAFFSHGAQRDLGTLVILDHVLAGERFNDYASHLSATDRHAARQLLDNQRTQLRERVRLYLEGAYGIGSAPAGSLGDALEPGDQIQSLDATFQPRPPVGSDLGTALDNLLDQALAHEWPAHPHFGVEIRPAVVKKVYAEVQRAYGEANWRVQVDRAVRPVLQGVAQPLQLGEVHENYFVLSDHWLKHFRRKLAQDGGPLTVAKLRAWTDDPQPRGLPLVVQNLLVLVYADLENHAFRLHGGPAGEVLLDALEDEMVLEPISLPAPDEWRVAGARAGSILGIAAPQLLNATNAARLTEEARTTVSQSRSHCEQLCKALRARLLALDLDPAATPRMQTATAVLGLVEAIANAPAEKVAATLARAEVHTSESAMGSSLRRAREVAECLESIRWEILEAAWTLTDERAAQGRAIRERVGEVLTADELAIAARPALKAAEDEAVRLITKPVPQPPPVSPPSTIRLEAEVVGATLEQARQVFHEVEAALQEDVTRRVDLKWKIIARGRA